MAPEGRIGGKSGASWDSMPFIRFLFAMKSGIPGPPPQAVAQVLNWTAHGSPHSYLSATIGSTVAARRAGI